MKENNTTYWLAGIGLFLLGFTVFYAYFSKPILKQWNAWQLSRCAESIGPAPSPAPSKSVYDQFKSSTGVFSQEYEIYSAKRQNCVLKYSE